jgi:hypothetical protein
MPVSERTFQQLALAEPKRWELVCGNLRRKPGMTFEHNHVTDELFFRLRQQLDPSQFHVRDSMGRSQPGGERPTVATPRRCTSAGPCNRLHCRA